MTKAESAYYKHDMPLKRMATKTTTVQETTEIVLGVDDVVDWLEHCYNIDTLRFISGLADRLANRIDSYKKE